MSRRLARSPVTSLMPGNCRTFASVVAIQPPQVQPLMKKPVLARAAANVVACLVGAGGWLMDAAAAVPAGWFVGVAAGDDAQAATTTAVHPMIPPQGTRRSSGFIRRAILRGGLGRQAMVAPARHPVVR